MIKKQLFNPQSIRKTEGSFSFIEHRFLRQGLWESLDHHELLLYLLLILVADCQRISFYSYDNICCRAELILEEYILARNGLMSTELTAFDGFSSQMRSLPLQPVTQTQRPTPGYGMEETLPAAQNIGRYEERQKQQPYAGAGYP